MYRNEFFRQKNHSLTSFSDLKGGTQFVQKHYTTELEYSYNDVSVIYFFKLEYPFFVDSIFLGGFFDSVLYTKIFSQATLEVCCDELKDTRREICKIYPAIRIGLQTGSNPLNDESIKFLYKRIKFYPLCMLTPVYELNPCFLLEKGTEIYFRFSWSYPDKANTRKLLSKKDSPVSFITGFSGGEYVYL